MTVVRAVIDWAWRARSANPSFNLHNLGFVLGSRWANGVQRYRSLADTVLSVENQSLQEALSYYSRINLDRRGSREEIDHYFRIYDWYREVTSENRAAIQQCAEALNMGWSELSSWKTVAHDALQRSEASATIDRKIRVLDATTTALSVLSGQRACAVPTERKPPPKPLQLGESLGPLALAAAWLLNAASLPLALIVGLVGFGLLGSVISTFVREQADGSLSQVDARGNRIVTDLVGVILRGLSAAIVVFLAVQGGLAVLSGEGGKPNPYVLLLACFVAAVFSERVWRSAHGYLATKLPGPDDEVTEAQRPGSRAAAEEVSGRYDPKRDHHEPPEAEGAGKT